MGGVSVRKFEANFVHLYGKYRGARGARSARETKSGLVEGGRDQRDSWYM